MHKHRGTGYMQSGGRSAAKHETNMSTTTGTGIPVGAPDMYPEYTTMMLLGQVSARSQDTEYPTSGRA